MTNYYTNLFSIFYREIFYMQARQMLIDNEINVFDWKQAARFIALISQAEGVKFIPELLSENGQRVISDFYERLKQKVKFIENKHFDNCIYIKRNSIDEVKFCKEKTVMQTNSNEHLEKFILEHYLEHVIIPESDSSNIDDINSGNNCSRAESVPNDFLISIAKEHQKINNISQSSAKYWLLEEFSTLQHFGEEMFEGMLISESETNITQQRNEKIQIAVNSQGLNVKKLDSNKSYSIPFSAVESAKSLRRCFHLCYVNENYVDSNLVIKFTSHRIAGTLYRALTEKHSFYSCETVHKNVETQFIRDLKVRFLK